MMIELFPSDGQVGQLELMSVSWMQHVKLLSEPRKKHDNVDVTPQTLIQVIYWMIMLNLMQIASLVRVMMKRPKHVLSPTVKFLENLEHRISIINVAKIAQHFG